MVSKALDDLNVRQSMMIGEANASATNVDGNIALDVSGMFLAPTPVTGRATVAGLPVVASNEYGKLSY